MDKISWIHTSDNQCCSFSWIIDHKNIILWRHFPFLFSSLICHAFVCAKLLPPLILMGEHETKKREREKESNYTASTWPIKYCESWCVHFFFLVQS